MRRWWRINMHGRVHVLFHRHVRVYARLYCDRRLLFRAQTAHLLHGLIASGPTARHVLPGDPDLQMVMVRGEIEHYSIHREARVEASRRGTAICTWLPPLIIGAVILALGGVQDNIQYRQTLQEVGRIFEGTVVHVQRRVDLRTSISDWFNVPGSILTEVQRGVRFIDGRADQLTMRQRFLCGT